MPSELLKNLVEQAHESRLVLPDFQRDFVWKPSDVIKLLASLLNGYPIGGLLFMESPGIYGHRALDGVIAKEEEKDAGDIRLILDGQQRLTSCYRALFGGEKVARQPGRYYFDYKKFVASPDLKNSDVEELLSFIREKDVRANLSNSASEQGQGLFPLDIILREPPPRGTNYSKWLSDYTFTMSKGDKAEFDRLSQLQSDFIRRFIEKITGYQVHFEEIKKGTSSDVICTVFETINTTGMRLTIFDLLVARCFPHKMNLREMLETALDRVSIKMFDPDGEGIAPTALPRIIALREKETARRADILELPPAVIKKHWVPAVDALERALELMTERYGCFGEKFVPLVDVITPLAVIISSDKFKHTEEHYKMLDRWYWRGIFSQYLISAPETKIQRTVRQWISGEGEKKGWLDDPANEPDGVRDFSYRATILDDVSRKDNAIYRGVMSLLLSQKIRDFGPDRKSLAEVPWEEIEDHHIYPQRFLGPYGIRGERANNIANRTPLRRATNQAIANTAPHVYLTDPRIVGTQPIVPMLAAHLIDDQIALQPFSADVYKRFYTDRSERILATIRDAVGADPIADTP
jgi:hypothetical protein